MNHKDTKDTKGAFSITLACSLFSLWLCALLVILNEPQRHKGGIFHHISLLSLFFVALCLGGYTLQKSDIVASFWEKFYHNKTKSQ